METNFKQYQEQKTYEKPKEHRVFEQTNFFIKRSRDTMDLILDFNRTRYKILGIDYEMLMQDVTDKLVLHSMAVVDGQVKLKESNLEFIISLSGKILVLHHKDDIYTVPLDALDRVYNGKIKGKSLTRLMKKEEECDTSFLPNQIEDKEEKEDKNIEKFNPVEEKVIK